MQAKLLALLVTSILVFSSCDGAPVIVFLNNSGRTLNIHAENKNYRLEKSGVLEITYPATQKFTIANTDEGELWEYEVSYPPKEYMPSRGMNLGVIRCQIEANGEIYILTPEVSAPVKELSPQPKGFPLVPKQRTQSNKHSG